VVVAGVVEGSEVGWSVGEKSLLAGRRLPFKELESPGERAGSLTLLTQASEVRFAALEVEGEVREEWLRQECERAAVGAFETLESAAETR
jgi:hypothetical protein